jgi:hypothetical protein
MRSSGRRWRRDRVPRKSITERRALGVIAGRAMQSRLRSQSRDRSNSKAIVPTEWSDARKWAIAEL